MFLVSINLICFHHHNMLSILITIFIYLSSFPYCVLIAVYCIVCFIAIAMLFGVTVMFLFITISLLYQFIAIALFRILPETLLKHEAYLLSHLHSSPLHHPHPYFLLIVGCRVQSLFANWTNTKVSIDNTPVRETRCKGEYWTEVLHFDLPPLFSLIFPFSLFFLFSLSSSVPAYFLFNPVSLLLSLYVLLFPYIVFLQFPFLFLFCFMFPLYSLSILSLPYPISLHSFSFILQYLPFQTCPSILSSSLSPLLPSSISFYFYLIYFSPFHFIHFSCHSVAAIA